MLRRGDGGVVEWGRHGGFDGGMDREVRWDKWPGFVILSVGGMGGDGEMCCGDLGLI